MNEELNRGREVFKEEAYELLAKLESTLLKLEASPDNKEMIERAFRAMHTLKGSGSMFGFDAVANLTHEAETVYDLVRRGRLKVTKELVDLTFRVIDQIKVMIGRKEKRPSLDNVEVEDIIFSFKKFLSQAVIKNKQSSSSLSQRHEEIKKSISEGDMKVCEKENRVTYQIHFQPEPNVFLKGFNLILILNELSQLGRCTPVAHSDSIPDLDHIDPETCYTYWDILLSTATGINAIRDVFIFIEDNCQIDIHILDQRGILDSEEAHKHLSSILLERRELNEHDVETILSAIGNVNVSIDTKSSEFEQQRLAELRQTADANKGQQMEVSSIRVAAQKLDKLVNLVGELVTVQARLTQSVTIKDDPEMFLIAEEIERLTDELRDNTMNIRLVPIGTMFNSFRRLVRDLSNELVKEMEFITEGGETELDKNVIEKLHDPLVHIIRNSIDHGIERPEVRVENGKRRTGLLHLAAQYSGASVLIKVKDDGSGIDPEKIRKDAVAKGLIKEDALLTESEILSIIFSPGFSTSEKVTTVSGRGVGLDVVKRSIDKLRGTIEIDSRNGAGTTITLKIPLTLAIIEGLLLKVGNHQYIVPLSAVEECIELTRKDISDTHGRHLVNVRGKIVPYIRLREVFHIDGTLPEIEQVVITEANGKKVGLAVDHVIGEHQTVIKSLGRIYRDVDIASGATILGNGVVAIILNVPKIIEYTENEEIAVTRDI